MKQETLTQMINPLPTGKVIYRTANYDVVIGDKVETDLASARKYWITNTVTGIVEAEVALLFMAIALSIHYDETLIKLQETLDDGGDVDTRLLAHTPDKLDS